MNISTLTSAWEAIILSFSSVFTQPIALLSIPGVGLLRHNCSVLLIFQVCVKERAAGREGSRQAGL